ncbi:hypothetical protein C7H85_03235 [Zobellella endophytica]|uniref:Uncharacterized protein n=1 Tax=Zobellella endophytica TaxID=2116700 RepID=A0A2P7RC93_9GAMM|nr:hypothetical protein [Zobellella endophytica]PSJ47841.1 hypothetical protein C7H85_03235 [Zobellella endophytica]
MSTITLNLSENDLDVLRTARTLSAAAQLALAEYRALLGMVESELVGAAYERWLALDKQAERQFALFARICSVQITSL